jgi:hypothetical protein
MVGRLVSQVVEGVNNAAQKNYPGPKFVKNKRATDSSSAQKRGEILPKSMISAAAQIERLPGKSAR